MPDKDVNERWLGFLDFGISPPTARMSRHSSDYLFSSGRTYIPEYCEENVDDAYLTNTISVENATHIANDLGIPLLYISTAASSTDRRIRFDDWTSPIRSAIMPVENMGELFVTQIAGAILSAARVDDGRRGC